MNYADLQMRNSTVSSNKSCELVSTWWRTSQTSLVPRFNLNLFFLERVGLDLHEGCVRDNKKAGVFEPAISKIKSLKFATEAAITILRIDDMIKLVPADKGDQGPSYQDAVRAGTL